MRIIAGKFGGRLIKSPHNNITHPMSEKIRGAIFNALGDLHATTFFDPFAGTGACSIEALSRGAAHATLIEANTESFKTIQQNLKDLGLENNATAIRGNCSGWSRNNKAAKFDIVLADPPYTPQHIDIALAFAMAKHVRPNGIFVLSVPPAQKETVTLRASQQPTLQLLRHKTYGDATIWFYAQKGVTIG